MDLYFLIADQNGRHGPDVKGIHLKANDIDNHDELTHILDSVRNHEECQDKFYIAGFDSIEYNVVNINGVVIGQFDYTVTQFYEWTNRIVKALLEQHPNYAITTLEPEALAKIIDSSGGLTLDDLSGPWKGIIVRN